jgi:hypothetical protein
MNAQIVVIDAFDHLDYANPVSIAAGVSVPRSGHRPLTQNYSIGNRKHVDRRAPKKNDDLSKFNGPNIERVQYLLLGVHPLPIVVPHTHGYSRRKIKSDNRWDGWGAAQEMEDGNDIGPALEVIHSFSLVDPRRIAAVWMPRIKRRRIRVDVTPPDADARCVYPVHIPLEVCIYIYILVPFLLG